MKNFALLGVVAGLLLTVVMSGCSAPRVSETGRTAVEQFLISNVVERSIGSVDFRDFAGKKVFIEYDNLDTQVDKAYVKGYLELHLASNGVIVSRDTKDADFVLQIICGALATDTNRFTFGTPALPIPIPDTSLSLAIPEIALFQKLTRAGYGKFSFNILEAQTHKPIRTITGIEAVTRYTNWTILLLPLKSHDMPMSLKEGTQTNFDIDWQ